MKLDLAIIGQGAVSPLGMGIDALRRNYPEATLVPEVRRPHEFWPVLRVDQKAPELVRWQREPRLRRSSPITQFLIETAEQALAGSSPEDRAQTGLVIAFSTGCLVYSRRFFQGMIKEGRNRASPALFPETVFNSPGSHVAAALKLNGAAYALVGDEVAFVAGIKTAATWLALGRVRQVLVLGADEFDPLTLDAYVSSRWLRRDKCATRYLPSEGAGGILLRQAVKGDRVILTAAHDGFTYRNAQGAALAAEDLFREIESETPILPTAQGTWLDGIERKMLGVRKILTTEKMPDPGHAFTASAAWTILCGVGQLSETTPALTLPVWGLNHQLGAVELRLNR